MTGLGDKTTAESDPSEGLPPFRPQATLLLYHRDDVRAVPLPGGRALVVGRSTPSDVVLDDPSLSRQHARIVWQDGALRVDDLGSTNGTFVRGDRVDGWASVPPGESFQLGAVTASVNVAGADGLVRGISSHERFLVRLEDELTRARTFRRPAAVAMIRALVRDERVEGHASRWLPRIRAALRPVDAVAIYAPGAALVLLPETDAGEAARIVASLVRTPALGEPRLVAGVSCFPDASSADEIVDLARRGARTATPDEPLCLLGARSDAAKEARAITAQSRAMADVVALVRRVAPSHVPVLVLGETGAGKELVARAIHEESPRRARALRSVNCGAIPEALLESVLFGHERGAFTGAEERTVGLFEQASGGTVFLDEVGELSPAAQAALLRVLETRRLCRVGSVEEVEVDVRVVCATHRDLEAMVAEGTFRMDLFYRLNAITIRVPPLRERPEDVDVLADAFLADAVRGTGRLVRGIDERARTLLRTYAWPGNVRELRNVIERAVLVGAGERIVAEDLGDRIGRPARASTHAQLAGASPATTGTVGEPDAEFKDRIRAIETDMILDALRRAEGNQTLAAKLLRMPLRTLVHKIRQYGIKKEWRG